MTGLTFDPAALKELLDAATPGPWRAHDTWLTYGGMTATVLAGDGPTALRAWLPSFSNDPASVMERNVWADAQFIAAARNELPALLDALAAAREELAERSQTFKTLWREFELTSKRMVELTEELAEAKRERDAYRKAKGENDERFQLERDAARAEADKLRVELAHVTAELAGTRQMLDVLTADDKPAINSAGVGAGNCNCQAIKGTPNFPGPWHPRGDTPTCLKLAAVPGDGEQAACAARSEKGYGCTLHAGHRRETHVAMALPKEGGDLYCADEWPVKEGDGEQAATTSHGWTSHGYACCGEAKTGERPNARARCMGNPRCAKCKAEAERIHAALPTSGQE